MSQPRKKDKIIQIRMTEVEYEEMEAFIDEKGIHTSVSDFIRNAIREKMSRIFTIEELRALVSQEFVVLQKREKERKESESGSSSK